MKTKIFFSAVLIFILLGCNKEDDLVIDKSNLLLGNWDSIKGKDGELTFKRVDALQANNYGVSFKEDNIFVNRTSGWCGTPPLTYHDVKGTFISSDEIISIKSSDYMGNYSWKIILLNNEKLIVKYLSKN